MKELYLVKVKMLKATDNDGERVQINSTYHNHTEIVSYDYKFNNALEVAEDYLKNDLGINVEFCNNYGDILLDYENINKFYDKTIGEELENYKTK